MKRAGEVVHGALIEVLIDVALGPSSRLALMAARAGVRRANRRGQGGLRQPKTVIAAVVDHHVGPLRHVTVGAETSFATSLVEVVSGNVIYPGLVATDAKRVALRA